MGNDCVLRKIVASLPGGTGDSLRAPEERYGGQRVSAAPQATTGSVNHFTLVLPERLSVPLQGYKFPLEAVDKL